MKIMDQPHKKTCKLNNFHWKICGNSFQGPSYKGQQHFKGSLFASGPPTSVCEQSPMPAAKNVHPEGGNDKKMHDCIFQEIIILYRPIF